MTRREFIKRSAIMSAGLPLFNSLLLSCDDGLTTSFDVNFSGKVLVIGAGSAGLMAGHILTKYNIDFEILEASSVFGGRVKKLAGFADFPIDLGAEWIHTDPSILAELLNNPNEQASIDFIIYNPKEIYNWHNGKLKKRNIISNFYSEFKFKNTTWYDYFDQYIVPNFSDRIRYNQVVNAIDYASDKVTVTTQNDSFEADKILLTVPLTILQQNDISFTPSLPTEKQDAINATEMPDGIKVFIEFSEKFYPDLILPGKFTEVISSQGEEKTFYDAAFGKDTNSHVFALFTVGAPATPYASLPNDQAVVDQVLAELDEMFEGKASATYIKHAVQNWSKSPHIRGSYSFDDANRSTLARPIDDKIYFAGEAYSELSHATVHGAGASAYVALEELLRGE